VTSLPILRSISKVWETDPRQDPNPLVYTILTIGAIAYPIWAQISTGGQGDFLISVLADAGVYILLAIGLNVVVGFAGLLDLGYAAFFAIGAYTYAFLASEHLVVTPLGMAIHLPFWIVLLVGMFVAAGFGLILGAPTLRLRGDYLAIVTLGFGEIVPRVFKNLSTWTSGVNGISALDKPVLPVWLQGPWSGDPLQVVHDFKIISPLAFYVVMVILLGICVVLVNNLRRSRVGRAWMAVREDEVAAAAMGVNLVRTKLWAYAIGAALGGFAGVFLATYNNTVNVDQFEFGFSVFILSMVIIGGMGNIWGVILGAVALSLFNRYGLKQLNGVPDKVGLHFDLTSVNYGIFGFFLLVMMVLRPEGFIPSGRRKLELHESEIDESDHIGTESDHQLYEVRQG
jgi:branched-chain amino acid transport system permease protein